VSPTPTWRTVGLQAPIEIEPKARYQRRDVDRWAEYYGAPLRYPDPFRTLKTMRAAMFFGNDRLHFVAAALERRTPGP
jgi:2-hydroxychromene-2-carboxylate isomerase